jgi:hypothetical protein
MDSFRPQPPDYIIKYDASLTGLGVGIHAAIDDTLLVYSALQLPFDITNESKRQNNGICCCRLRITVSLALKIQ